MFLFRGSGVGNSASLRALRALYRSFNEQNGPEARARRLLREWLSPDQRAQFDAEDYFEVTGSHTGRRYRVHYGTVSNVVQVDEAGQPRSGGVSFPKLLWRPATSCSLRKSRSKLTKWPSSRLPTGFLRKPGYLGWCAGPTEACSWGEAAAFGGGGPSPRGGSCARHGRLHGCIGASGSLHYAATRSDCYG